MPHSSQHHTPAGHAGHGGHGSHPAGGVRPPIRKLHIAAKHTRDELARKIGEVASGMNTRHDTDMARAAAVSLSVKSPTLPPISVGRCLYRYIKEEDASARCRELPNGVSPIVGTDSQRWIPVLSLVKETPPNSPAKAELHCGSGVTVSQCSASDSESEYVPCSLDSSL